MAFDVLHWTLHLRAKRREKVLEHLQRWEARIGEPVTVVTLEPYWKAQGMFVVQFTTPLACEERSEALFRAMTAASRIHPHWQTTGPSEYEGGKWEFSAMTRDAAHGYELIQFEVRNYEPSSWQPVETEGTHPSAS